MPFDDSPHHGGGGDPAHNPKNLQAAVELLSKQLDEMITATGLCDHCLGMGLVGVIIKTLWTENPDDKMRENILGYLAHLMDADITDFIQVDEDDQ